MLSKELDYLSKLCKNEKGENLYVSDSATEQKECQLSPMDVS